MTQTVSVPTVLVTVGRCLAPTGIQFLPHLPETGVCVWVAVGGRQPFHGDEPRGDIPIAFSLSFELDNLFIKVITATGWP